MIGAQEWVADGVFLRLRRRRSWQAIADVSVQPAGDTLCSVLLVAHDSATEVEATAPWTIAGLRALGVSIADAVGYPDFDGRAGCVHPVGRQSLPQGGWTEAGWDFSGPRLIVATPSEPLGISATPLQAVLASTQPTRWLIGDDAVRCDPILQRLTSYDAWSRIEDMNRPRSAEVNELNALSIVLSLSSSGEHAPDPSAHLAIAAPDYLDEGQVHLLRATLPSTAARRTMVWRSIAVTLKWRKSGAASSVEAGDPVLVLDLDSLSACATLLEMNADQRPSADPIVWERVPPEQPGEEAQQASSRAMEVASVRQALANYCSEEIGIGDMDQLADSIVDEGWLEATLENPKKKVFIQRPIGQTELRGIAVTSELLLELLHSGLSLEKRLESWLGTVRTGTTWALLIAAGQVPRGLVLSRLCADSRIKARVIAIVKRVLPDLDIHVLHDRGTCASGALVYVQRDLAHLPTWRDRLPDL
ncbi:MAG: hypothetical protein ABIS27_11745, partial [Longimicrobiales bacterium]